MSYLVDTNILLRSSDPNHVMYADATTALKNLRQRKETLYITAQNLVEFWNVYTRGKKQNGLGGSMKGFTIRLISVNIHKPDFPLASFASLRETKKTSGS